MYTAYCKRTQNTSSKTSDCMSKRCYSNFFLYFCNRFMLFNSIEFLIFLPIVFSVYWLLHKHLRWQNAFVVAASYLFYGWWDWRFLLLIAFTTLCSYISGRQIASTGSNSTTSRKLFLWGNIIINLLILGVFKYYDFFAQSFADAFLGGQADHLLLHLVLPVGISFHT